MEMPRADTPGTAHQSETNGNSVVVYIGANAFYAAAIKGGAN
jgi:hypothetical protein